MISRLKRLVLAVAAGLLGCVSCISIYLYLFQERMIYHPRPYTQLQASAGLEALDFKTSQGKQTAFYLAAHNGVAPAEIWILFAGNASLALDWRVLVECFNAPDKAFLLVEYPGYGCSEGDPSPETILESSRAAVRALAAYLNIDLAQLRLNVVGHSLGAAAALQFSSKEPVERVILVAPFTSMHAMAERLVGFPLSLLLKHDFDNQARMAELARRAHPPRVTIIHGTEDPLIPLEMGRELAMSYPQFTSFHPVEGAGHDSILFDALKEIAAAIRAVN